MIPGPVQVVVMGPSASGKSTVGAALADALGVPFIDGDALHPPTNVALMAAGTPLTDADREPWLAEVGRTVDDALATGGVVVACSALRRAYRDLIRVRAPRAWFLELEVSEELAHARASSRPGHFMPASLVASQLTLLEPLGRDEQGLTVDASRPVAEIVAAGVASLR